MFEWNNGVMEMSFSWEELTCSPQQSLSCGMSNSSFPLLLCTTLDLQYENVGSKTESVEVYI